MAEKAPTGLRLDIGEALKNPRYAGWWVQFKDPHRITHAEGRAIIHTGQRLSGANAAAMDYLDALLPHLIEAWFVEDPDGHTLAVPAAENATLERVPMPVGVVIQMAGAKVLGPVIAAIRAGQGGLA